MEIFSFLILFNGIFFHTFVLYKRQTMKSDKPTKKSNTYNVTILTGLAAKYGFTVDYIRKCLRNDRTGIMPDQLKKDYATAEAQARAVIAEQLGTSKD